MSNGGDFRYNTEGELEEYLATMTYNAYFCPIWNTNRKPMISLRLDGQKVGLILCDSYAKMMKAEKLVQKFKQPE